MKLFTSQLLRGALDALLATTRTESVLGLHTCAWSVATFSHFFQVATWFMQYCRYQEEKRVARKGKEKAGGDEGCAAASIWHATVL